MNDYEMELLATLSQPGGGVRKYLQNISVELLKAKIEDFEKLQLDELEEDEIGQKFSDVLSARSDSNNIGFAQVFNPVHLPVSSRYFRIRRFRNKTTPAFPPFEGEMTTMKDAWEPPPEFTNMQRCNRDGEPLLYVGVDDPAIAIAESRVEENELFSFMIYKPKAIITVRDLVNPYAILPEDATEANMEKVKLIARFIANQLYKKKQSTDENFYKLTNAILNNTFELIDKDHFDGWKYWSVAYGQGENLALLPDNAHNKLEIQCIAICKVVFGDGARYLVPQWVYSGKTKGDNLEFLDASTEKNSQYFGMLLNDQEVPEDYFSE